MGGRTFGGISRVHSVLTTFGGISRVHSVLTRFCCSSKKTSLFWPDMAIRKDPDANPRIERLTVEGVGRKAPRMMRGLSLAALPWSYAEQRGRCFPHLPPRARSRLSADCGRGTA